MNKLSASKLFILGIDGVELSFNEEKFLAHNELGGVLLFKKNIESLEQVVQLNSQITNANLAHPPVISVDQEGGRVARLRGICTDLPPMAALTKQCELDPNLPFRIGAMLGRELVALGFGQNFAPVCDIATQESEVIGDRSFSRHAKTVAEITAQLIKGMQGAGLAACAKHFPGHGATSLDSHLMLPTVDTDKALLESRELIPFKNAIAADVASIMSAHIVVEKLHSRVPATLSPIVMHDLLRKTLGFTNVIISDDLDMRALADHYSLQDILEQGLLASIDQFIIGNDFNKGLAAITILQELINKNERLALCASEAIARVDRMKTRYIGTPLAPNLADAQKIVRCSPHLDLIGRCV